MCVALPGRVIAVAAGRATVETASGRREVSIAPLPDLRAGEHVLVSLGMALQRITAVEAAELAALWADLAIAETESEPPR